MTPRKAVAASAAFACLMMILVGVGQYHSFTVAPIWDMWNGEVEFFMKARSGDLLAWFGQHNEHRITLARLLFWADLDWFGGRSIFLYVANFLLAGAGALLFWRIAGDTATQGGEPVATRTERTVFGLLLTAWIFQWTQSENFIWAFQSQFFMVQLAPLAGVYWLSKSTPDAKGDRAFFIACVFGFASLGAMANGVFALPAMTFYALLVRQPPFRVATLAALTVVGVVLFLHGYYRPDHNAPPWVIFMQHPGRTAYFTLLYLSNAFFALTESSGKGHMIAVILSLLLIGGCVERLVSALRAPSRNQLQLALLSYLAFLGGSALLTATGRVQIGLDAALVSRYATPSIMAWATFAVLNAKRLISMSRAYPRGALAAAGIGSLVLLSYQLSALKPRRDVQFNWNLSALALELGVMDRQQIGNLFPNDYVFGVAENAHKQKVSMFGLYPYRGDRESIGQKVAMLRAVANCQGAMSEATEITGDDRFVAVSGWTMGASGRVPRRLRILDGQGRVAGYALTGADAGPGRPAGSAFKGYMLASLAGQAATILGDHPDCAEPIRAAHLQRLFTSHLADPSPAPDVANEETIEPGNQWTGADFYHSAIPGMKIYGSVITGDRDVGAVRLKVKPGDRIFYRSGPTGGRQIMTVLGLSSKSVIMPVSTGWTELRFVADVLPQGESSIEIADRGDGWGEWSAIAVRPAGH